MSAAEDIDGILSETGLQSYLENNRIELMGQSDAFRQGATILRQGLKNYIRVKGGGMMDTYRAGKVVKPMFHAGDLLEEAAKMLGTTWALYNGLIIPLEQKNTNTKGDTFQPRK
jgi:hypothetical protein